MKHKAKILGHEGFIIGTLESSANDGFNDIIKDEFGNKEYIDVTTIESCYEKPYLINYSLNYNGYKGLTTLVYAYTYELAIEKLRNNLPKRIGCMGTTSLISHSNLTIEQDSLS